MVNKEDAKKIHNYLKINKENMLQDIQQLIRIESVYETGQAGMPFGTKTAEALSVMLKKAEEMGFITHNYDNYAGTADFMENDYNLDILVHLDVVPGQSEWKKTTPFQPVIIKNMLYGRGASDDKGPAVAALYAMKAVKDLKIPIQRNVRLILGTDEECGGRDLTYYYAKEREAAMTFSPDAEFPVTNTEKGILRGIFEAEVPASWEVPGILRIHGGDAGNVIPDYATAEIVGLQTDEVRGFADAAFIETGITFRLEERTECLQIHAYGTSAHGAGPQLGNNAVTGLLCLLCRLPLSQSEGLKKLKGLYHLMPHGDYLGKAMHIDMEDELSGELTNGITVLCYEKGKLYAAADCRIPICSMNIDLRKKIIEEAGRAGLNAEKTVVYPPHHVSGETKFIKTLLKCYENVTGKAGVCNYCCGATYVHALQNGVAFGCIGEGTDTHMHGPDEFMKISDLITGAEIYAQAIISLCQ